MNKLELAIDIYCSKYSDDYHDQVMIILNRLPNYLQGGYYEPKSDRDIALAKKLEEFCRDYEKSLKS